VTTCEFTTPTVTCCMDIKAVLLEKYVSDPDPNILRLYILPIFKAVPIVHSLANTPDIQ